MHPTTAKYLARYAQPEATIAAELSGSWAHAVVIPVLAEALASLVELATGVPAGTLFIVVVNASDARSAAEHQANRELLEALGGEGRGWFRSRLGGADALVIDRASEGRRLPAGEGVGLARRIGLDVALALRTGGRLADRFLRTTDADVELPPDYFDARVDEDAAMLSYRFWHDTAGGDPVSRHTALYELWLRHYVVGLRRAGSPYAHHCLGSCLGVDADAYARVRGMPRRQGGEDFYLMNKLAKLGTVDTPRCEPLRIAPRISTRAPFGTGPAVARMLEGESLELYHPRCFDDLGRWLEALEQFAVDGEPAPAAIFGALPEPIRRTAESIGARAALERIGRDTAGTDARRSRLRNWFDAQKTMLFVRRLSENHHGTLPWREALSPWDADAADIDAARHWLAARDHGSLDP